MLLATTVKKIFFAIIVLSAIVRVYYFFVLPEGAYNDSLYHLNIVGKILGQKTFSLQGIDVPPPFYYSVFASLLSQSHLGLNSFTAKIFPFAIELLSLILAFVVFKKMFNENYFVPLAFFSVFPWVVRFSGINYAENLSVVFVLSSLYFLLNLKEKKETGLFSIFPLIFSISALSLTKLNAAILVPVFFLAALYLLYMSKASLKVLGAFSILAITLSGFWFFSNLLQFGVIDQHIKSDAVNFGPSTGFSANSIIQNLLFYFLYFFDFPNQSAFEPGGFLWKLDFLLLSAVFFAIVLPLFFLIIFGVKKMAFQKNIVNIAVLLMVLVSFIPIIQRTAYYRLIIPVVPLISIVFARGFFDTKNSKLKSMALVSFVLFSFYSMALVSVSAYEFSNAYSKHSNLFAEISKLDNSSLVLVNSNMQRQVNLFSGKKAFGMTPNEQRLNTKTSSDFYNSFKEYGITHIAKTCYKDTLNQSFLGQLVQSGKLQKIYSDNCGAIYRVW